MTWYEFSPERLVLECLRMQTAFPGFELVWNQSYLAWQGTVSSVPAGVQASPLEIRLTYRHSFPASAPWVQIISPELDMSLVGHDWHRWYDGSICYIKPTLWGIQTTAMEILTKVEDWYFNFLAKQHGLISDFPDVGRAKIEH